MLQLIIGTIIASVLYFLYYRRQKLVEDERKSLNKWFAIIMVMLLSSLCWELVKESQQSNGTTAGVVKTTETLFVENKKVFRKGEETCVSFELDGKSFILTEYEYNKCVGAESDAVDTEIYTLKIDSDYVDKSSGCYSDCSSIVPKALDNLGVNNNCMVNSADSIYSLELEPFDSYTITCDDSRFKYFQYSSRGEVIRYSFLGQSNFTESEIEEYKNSVKKFYTSFLDSLHTIKKGE